MYLQQLINTPISKRYRCINRVPQAVTGASSPSQAEPSNGVISVPQVFSSLFNLI